MVTGFEGVIAGIAESGAADVADGDQALDLVMASAVHGVGKAKGEPGGGSFDADEERTIVHYPVAEQNFLAAPVAHVSGGGVIEHPEHRHAAEEPRIFPVPEGVRCRLIRGG